MKKSFDCSDAPSDSIHHLCSLIHWNMHSFIREKLKDLDVGRGQIQFLMVLRSNQGLNQDELAAILEMNKSTVARGLHKLEDADLVRRERKGRSYNLYLTEKASSYMLSLEGVWADANSLLVQEMLPNQIESLRSLLTSAYNNSKKEVVHAPK